ncbi:MAG TPA: hypothetical protein VG815_03895 [Chloroflexota bacterium]|nr:hypothetical protein [Chloroflexota bacterium]
MDPQIARVKALGTGDKVVGASLIVALIAMFLPWYGFSAPALGGGSVTGFHSWGIGYFLVWLVTAGLFGVWVFGSGSVQIPNIPFPQWQVYLAGGGLMFFTGLLFYTAVPSGSVLGYSYGVRFGWFVALLAALAVAAGGYLKRTETTV